MKTEYSEKAEKNLKNNEKSKNHYTVKYRKKLKEQGICANCNKKKLQPYSKENMCPECRVDYRRRQNELRSERVSKKLCKWCGNFENIEGLTSCVVCILQYTARKYFKTVKKWVDLFYLFKKQNGTCPYTGEKLYLGVNCSLDHIVPRSKNGSNEISNLQWVKSEINDMKGSLDNEQFISICKIISSTDEKTHENWDENEMNNFQTLIFTPKKDNRLNSGKKGEKHSQAKLKESDVLEIRRLYKLDNNKYNALFLSKKYNISKSSIGTIVRGIRWTHI